MKILLSTLGAVLVLVLLLAFVQFLASERVEVVRLHTLDLEGEEVTTRLWIVDDEGYQYLRVGANGSGWFSRLQAAGDFALSRDNRRDRYTAVLRQDKSARINQLMQEKYGWGDILIGLMAGSREDSIPIELHPMK